MDRIKQNMHKIEDFNRMDGNLVECTPQGKQ